MAAEADTHPGTPALHTAPRPPGQKREEKKKREKKKEREGRRLRTRKHKRDYDEDIWGEVSAEEVPSCWVLEGIKYKR